VNYKPCQARSFLYRLDLVPFYTAYLRWLSHLSARLGVETTRRIWQDAFAGYDDSLLMSILSSGWQQAASADAGKTAASLDALVAEFFPATDRELTGVEAKALIEAAPPVAQILKLFSRTAVEKEISAYAALHLRFDGLARLAGQLIEHHGKQGELIVYDLMTASRLAANKGVTGSVEAFIADFIAEPETPNLFSAGLEFTVVRSSAREALVHVRACEWARYFRERHSQVGYLMACSTDEVAYKAFNPDLRMQRTHTLMEGAGLCDFWIHAVDEKAKPGTSG